MPIIYPTVEEVLAIHQNILQVSEDALVGVRDINPLAGVIGNIQNDDWYPDFADKLTHLFFMGANLQCFASANKRVAITLAAKMLLDNGYFHCLPGFFWHMENIVYEVAVGRINRVLLHEIIVAYLDGNEHSEELQLKIFNAISVPLPPIEGC